MDRYFPFSAEELTIYHKLRCLIQEACCVKKKLKDIEALGVTPPSLLAEKQGHMKHLTQLRQEWASWKDRSAEAATRRMMALGHIQPDGTMLPGGCEGSCPLDDYPNLSV